MLISGYECGKEIEQFIDENTGPNGKNLSQSECEDYEIMIIRELENNKLIKYSVNFKCKECRKYDGQNSHFRIENKNEIWNLYFDCCGKKEIKFTYQCIDQDLQPIFSTLNKENHNNSFDYQNFSGKNPSGSNGPNVYSSMKNIVDMNINENNNRFNIFQNNDDGCNPKNPYYNHYNINNNNQFGMNNFYINNQNNIYNKNLNNYDNNNNYQYNLNPDNQKNIYNNNNNMINNDSDTLKTLEGNESDAPPYIPPNNPPEQKYTYTNRGPIDLINNFSVPEYSPPPSTNAGNMKNNKRTLIINCNNCQKEYEYEESDSINKILKDNHESNDNINYYYNGKKLDKNSPLSTQVNPEGKVKIETW